MLACFNFPRWFLFLLLFVAQGAAFIAFCHKLASNHAGAKSIFVRGATGPFSAKINGLFRPIKMKGPDGYLYYDKLGDDKMCIGHSEGKWRILLTTHTFVIFRQKKSHCKKVRNRGIGIVYAEIPGLCALEDCERRLWSVWDGLAFQNQIGCEVVIGDEAEELVSAHCIIF